MDMWSFLLWGNCEQCCHGSYKAYSLAIETKFLWEIIPRLVKVDCEVADYDMFVTDTVRMCPVPTTLYQLTLYMSILSSFLYIVYICVYTCVCMQACMDTYGDQWRMSGVFLYCSLS